MSVRVRPPAQGTTILKPSALRWFHAPRRPSDPTGAGDDLARHDLKPDEDLDFLLEGHAADQGAPSTFRIEYLLRDSLRLVSHDQAPPSSFQRSARPNRSRMD